MTVRKKQARDLEAWDGNQVWEMFAIVFTGVKPSENKPRVHRCLCYKDLQSRNLQILLFKITSYRYKSEKYFKFFIFYSFKNKLAAWK